MVISIMATIFVVYNVILYTQNTSASTAAPYKGTEYAKAFFNSGIKSMPKFNFSEEEKNDLAAFLEEIDHTGYYPNTNAEFEYNGWVTLKYK